MADNSKSQYTSGEKPPEGNYVCMGCEKYSLIVPEMGKKLPVCPNCSGRTWMKY